MRYLITGGSGFIGGYLVEELLAHDLNAEILIADVTAPTRTEHVSLWTAVDILDASAIAKVMCDFQPTNVVHLAAQIGGDEGAANVGFPVNTDGTRNVVVAVHACSTVERLMITSTGFVCRPGHMPANDEDYSPHTAYGESKVMTERIVRTGDLQCTWFIVRPGTVWGPGIRRQHHAMLHYMNVGKYVHPGRTHVRRPFGYVRNVVYIVRRLLESPPAHIHGKVFYACDLPTDLYDWVNGCSLRLLGRPVRVVPRMLVRAAGLFGDVMQKVGRRFPITSFRYRSMTEEYLMPIDKTLGIVGALPYSQSEAIDEFVAWFKAGAPVPATRAQHEGVKAS
jgi:nucleoside-diphosphate-sugar epimerase